MFNNIVLLVDMVYFLWEKKVVLMHYPSPPLISWGTSNFSIKTSTENLHISFDVSIFSDSFVSLRCYLDMEIEWQREKCLYVSWFCLHIACADANPVMVRLKGSLILRRKWKILLLSIWGLDVWLGHFISFQ